MRSPSRQGNRTKRKRVQCLAAERNPDPPSLPLRTHTLCTQVLRRKAEERNPDEFYFAMQKARTKDGLHVTK